jgi:hypothetical protein
MTGEVSITSQLMAETICISSGEEDVEEVSFLGSSKAIPAVRVNR